MPAIRPALAFNLVRSDDQPAVFEYDETRQFSIREDGTPAITAASPSLDTRADRDRPDPPDTMTKAARDPGDVNDAEMSRHQYALLLTEAARDPDNGDADEDSGSSDDLVSGIVAF